MAYEIRARMNIPPVGKTDTTGIEHDITVAIPDPDDNDKDRQHKIFPIPVDDFDDLVQPMSNTQRGELYKSLIRQYFGLPGEPAVTPPEEPTWPATGLQDLDAVNQYLDDYDQYEADQAQYEADFASINTQAATLATQATNWIESLPGFNGWPFYFTLQVGD